MALQLLVFILLFGSSLRLESVTGRRILGNETDRLSLLEVKKQIDDLLERFHPFRELGRNYMWSSSSTGLEGDLSTSLANCKTRLRGINFNINHLVGKIPVGLASLSKLEIISINDNGLTGEILASFGNLSSIRVISLAGNGLQGSIPKSFGQLRNLFFLALGRNKLSGSIPNSISNISTLQIFSISVNSFVGPVPNNLGDLQDLQKFVIGTNQCGARDGGDLDFVNILLNCAQIELLDLQANGFKGPIPNFRANISTQFLMLYLGENQISGFIPIDIKNLISLSTLGMEGNFLERNIPSSKGKLPKLQNIFLGGNRLSGQIPASIGNLGLLYGLHLEGNNLNSNIPSNIGNCQQLQDLTLNNNNLQGPIPKQLFYIFSLAISLDLSYNALDGSLPREIGNLKSLSTISVHENRFSGEIPSSIGDCNSLENLYMGGNFFEGTIPQTLVLLKGLRDLDHSLNNLSRQILKDLEKNSALQSLDFSFNNLEGEVPTKGIFRNASAILVNGNDKLCGGIAELKLPACTNHGSMKGGKSKTFGIVLVIIGVVFGIIGQDETFVAVKVLNLQNTRACKSFIAECKALRNICHQNLVKILASCSSLDSKGKDFKALFYKFMPNGSLDDWLHLPMVAYNHSRSLNFVQRLNIALDVASALDYLHYHCYAPIIHCDLKQSNVLLDNDKIAHVGDFGFARLLSNPDDDSSQTQTSTTRIKGSIGYAAPGNK
ncbi:putative receptor-like protein kinase At3g47110 [Macadamia integrifolia]|uniref:putative receptor-like protein kinase At3g47110 n=1 Tax=Macadamia integrifolia TaxID=60698 RepID=UPI001C4E413E|nr:putative receptor-like protein kinase At3g47110 [Macadamia integrifolia]